MNLPLFGPGGNAESFAKAGYTSTVQAPQWLCAQGLTAYEYQCGRGIHIGQETAQKIGEEAKQYGIALSIHAPYYINLSSREAERIEKNTRYVLDTCVLAQAMGASRITVHCGGQGKLSRQTAVQNTLDNLKHLLSEMDAQGFTSVQLCIETMGKQSVLGSAEEVFLFVASDDRLLPCIDFGHLNARTLGGCNTREHFEHLFDQMENTIGKARTQIFHSHFSKIEYTDKGEKRHLTFADTRYGPSFLPLAQVVAKRGYTPTFICESAGTQAEDAKTMQQIYKEVQANEKNFGYSRP